MLVGTPQIPNFTGSAVHGGGSCHLSVTLDRKPTKDSKFKVIHSIEGECPGRSSPSTFNFHVPKEVPNGQATLAWTWQNHIGNREFYMNCAPITVTGGANDTSAFEKLPDMAVANIASVNQCSTIENFDYLYADPGQYFTKIGDGPFAPLCGGGTVSAQPSPMPKTGAPAPVGSPSSMPMVNTSIPAQSSAPASSAPSQPMTSTVHALATVTGMPLNSSAPAIMTGAGTVESTPAVPATPVESSAPSAPPAAGGGASQPCSPDGSLVCNGSGQWGLCNFGKVVFQPVAVGTTCQNGQIQKRGYIPRMQHRFKGYHA